MNWFCKIVGDLRCVPVYFYKHADANKITFENFSKISVQPYPQERKEKEIFQEKIIKSHKKLIIPQWLMTSRMPKDHEGIARDRNFTSNFKIFIKEGDHENLKPKNLRQETMKKSKKYNEIREIKNLIKTFWNLV